MDAEGSGGFPDRGPAVFAVTTATLVLASVFVAARVWSRYGIVRKVGPDDYIIVLAWLIAFFLSFTIDLGTTRGLGRREPDIEPDDQPGLRACEYVFSILYNPALMATKTSVLVFYLRLAKNTQKIWRLASWVVLVIVNLAGVILTLMNIFQCRPLNAAWDVDVQAVQCIPLLTEFICSAPINITTDLAILALPIPVLTGMRLPPRQKTILVMTFALGVFVTIVDVVRIYYLQQAIGLATGVSSDPGTIFGQTYDFSWNASMSLMWSAVEVNIGITCACIPTLKPLIIRILPAMLVDRDGTRRSRTNTLGSSQLMDSGSKQESSSEGGGSQPATTNTATTGSQLDSPRELLAAARTQGSGNRMSEEVDIMDFLAGGGSGTGQGSNQRTRASMLGGRKVSKVTSNQENAVYFGFVNLKKPKSMLKTSAGESLKYCTVVSILFFLWGFSYGLLNTLNNVVAGVANMSQAQALGLTSIYFGGGYFFGPLLLGEWLLRRDEHHRTSRRRDSVGGQSDSVGGFKTTFIAGLLIYGTGTIMFWPSAVLSAYGGFMVSSFVVGFGLAVLETAANPFLALCGPPEYADARLLVAQGVQGVGSVLSGLLANNVFFSSLECAAEAGDGSPSRIGPTTLLDVQWTYLAVTLLCVLLALFFYYMPLPEVSDRELGRLAEKLPVDPEKRSIGGLQLRTWCLILAVASQWTYVAAQEIMSFFFDYLITAFVPPDSSVGGPKPPGFALSVSDYLSVAHTAFAVSRFGAGCLAYLSVTYPTNRFIPTPRTILSASAGFSALFILIAVVLKPTNNPNMMAIPVILFFLAEGPMWPLIFSLGLRGQGRQTKRAAAFLTMGASGPMFWPFVSYAITQRGGSIQTAFIVVIALMAFSLTYPLFLTFVKDARAMVDPFPGEHDNQQSKAGSRSGNGGGMLARRGSAATVLGLEHIIAQRQRTRSTAAEQVPRTGSDGVLFGKWAGRWERRKTASSANTGTSPIVEHHESQRCGSNSGSPPRSRQESQHHQPPQNQLQTESAAPWEDQVLDTSILDG